MGETILPPVLIKIVRGPTHLLKSENLIYWLDAYFKVKPVCWFKSTESVNLTSALYCPASYGVSQLLLQKS